MDIRNSLIFLVPEKEKELREISEAWDFDNPDNNDKYDLQLVFNTLVDLAVMFNGIGLAAPQIGIQKRLFVANIALGYDQQPQWHIFVNPTFDLPEARPINYADAEEGCLSIPGKFVNVTRPSEIIMKYTNPYGQECTVALTGLESRVVQHEIDHLNGVLITDYDMKEEIVL